MSKKNRAAQSMSRSFNYLMVDALFGLTYRILMVNALFLLRLCSNLCLQWPLLSFSTCISNDQHYNTFHIYIFIFILSIFIYLFLYLYIYFFMYIHIYMYIYICVCACVQINVYTTNIENYTTSMTALWPRRTDLETLVFQQESWAILFFLFENQHSWNHHTATRFTSIRI